MGKKQHSYVKNALILTVSGYLVKILGLYRIPLAALIGDEGMGLYQYAYPLYVSFLALSAQGLPPAIAKIVAEKAAWGDYQGAHRVFHVALGILAVLGMVFSALLIFGAPWFANVVIGDERAYLPMVSIAPAILIVSLMASVRGYFQGLQDMMPTATSQIVEQLGRVIVALGLAYILLPFGLEWAAAGAAFGPVVGALLGLAVLFIYYLRHRRELICRLQSQQSHRSLESPLELGYRIMYYAIPIGFAALVLPLISTLDTIIVPRRLQAAGFAIDQATALYGQLTGMAAPIINAIPMFAIAMSVSLVPSISEALSLGDYNKVSRRAGTAVKLTLLFALPSCGGLFVLGRPIAVMLFDTPGVGPLLQILSISLIFLMIQQTTSGILQGIGKTYIPVINLLIGAAFKVVANYSITAIPAFNIKGAAIGTLLSFFVASSLNLTATKRLTGLVLSPFGAVVKPLFSTVVMMVVTYAGYLSIRDAMGNTVATLAGILTGVTVYGIMLLVTRTFTKRDLSAIPGIGRRAVTFLERFGFLGR